MARVQDVLCALQNTSKGALVYHRDSLEESKIDSWLDECTSSPVIRCFSNHTADLGGPSHNGSFASLEGSSSGFLTSTPLSTKEDSSPSKKTPSKVESKEKRKSGSTPTDHKARDESLSQDDEEERKLQRAHIHYMCEQRRAEKAAAKQAQAALEKKRRDFEEHSAQLNKKMAALAVEQHKAREAECIRRLQKQDISNRDITNAFEEKQRELIEYQHKHAERFEQELRNVEAKKQEYERNQINKRNADNKVILSGLESKKAEVDKISADISSVMATCVDESRLPAAITQYKKLCAQIQEKCQAIIDTAKQEANTMRIKDGHLKLLTQLSNEMNHILNPVVTAVGAVNAQIEAERKAAAAITDNTTAAAAAVATATTKTSTAVTSAPAPTSTYSHAATGDRERGVLCAHEHQYELYKKLLQHRKRHIQSYQQLVDDTQLRRYKLDLTKAVNITVNAISAVSREHLQDKLEKLTALLQGKPVAIGNKQVAATQHPGAISMVKNLFATKIVDQGEVQVESNHQAAFVLSAVMMSVCSQIEGVMPLLVAYFYQKCPYLVPYYPPQLPGQTDEEHYRSQGYTYNDAGEIEKQDKFLARMSGIVRLYAAMMVTAIPPSAHNNKPHPRGIDQAWAWLTAMLNLQPRLDITATVLHSFLHVAGHALHARYGKQFMKMLRIMLDKYLSDIKNVTPGGVSGPVTRLEAFLRDSMAAGKVEPPPGLITSAYWTKKTSSMPAW